MDRDKFIQQYIVQFMASYAAVHYDDAIFCGKHERLADVRLVEEAETLAEMAYEAYCKLKLNG